MISITNLTRARSTMGRSAARQSRRATTALLLAGLVSGTATANPEIVAGYEGGSKNSYAFVSPMFAFALNDDSDIVLKPSANYLKYETREDGTATSVTAPGASIGLSYRHRGPKLTLDVGPSLEITREKRTLATGAQSTDRKIGVALSANAFYQADRNNTLSLLTNYSRTSRYFWSRAGAKTRILNRDYKDPIGLAVGPEATFQTGNGVTQFGGGVMTEIGFDRAATSLQFRAGYSRSRFSDGSRDSYPYFGTGIYHRF